ncbi:MAG TPA: MFS transporter, partial [Thermomicrobiales bacterium]|nr:MFS transporter [Thermomicrobiales bacterium]
TELILFRGLQGIAGGILMTNAFAIIGSIFPPAERGKWQGVTGSVFGFSSVAGPLLGGFFTDGPGWRWVFYINIPVGILAAIVLMSALPKIQAKNHLPIDWFGALGIIGSAVPLLLAFSWAGTEYPWGSVQVVGMLVLAAVFAIFFLWNESRAVDPILPLEMFRNRTFAIAVPTVFFIGAGMFGSISYIPLFMQTVVGVSATNSGIVLAPLMLSLVVASTTGGQIISRTGRYKWAVILGLSTMTIGLFLQSRMNINTTQGQAIVNMIFIGLGVGFVMPTMNLAVQNAFPVKRIGTVTASVQFFRSIGATIGIAVMGTVMSSGLKNGLQSDLPPDVSAKLPSGLVGSLNPQTLGSPESKDALRTQLSSLPDSAQLYDQLTHAMRLSIADAMHSMFLLAAVGAVFALLIGVFVPENPLRKKNTPDAGAGADQTSTAAIESPALAGATASSSSGGGND